ncbi:MAG: N-acetylneuraminate synthase family protein [Methanomicrobiales archaeon]|nr:N-acetylneuraminate synthase family protein [Methanomicrobiales archaeon]MDD1670238.1 N-acetylneuraminate synthase family protein [Methanomicrobiales archaeon]
MKIGSLDTRDRVIIVAEIGNNHEGSFENAEKLVGGAAACGADAVKFQVFRTEHLVSRVDRARFDQLKSFELSLEQFGHLADLAHTLDLAVLVTAFDPETARRTEGFADGYKIASGDNAFFPLLDAVARSGKPVIISTGSSDFSRISRAITFMEKSWEERNFRRELALLHCVSCYPVPDEQANLFAILSLAEKFGYPVGYSDHTLGTQASVMAVALGARIIEKHFTLSKSYSSFRDHQLSADPPELQDLVRQVRRATLMLGGERKVLLPCEVESAGAIRRSIVAGSDLPEGHTLLLSDLTWTRPAGGLDPGEEFRLIGKKLRHPVRFGDKLTEKDVL